MNVQFDPVRKENYAICDKSAVEGLDGMRTAP